MCILYVQNSRNRQKTGSTLKCTIEHIEPQSLTRGTENWKKNWSTVTFLQYAQEMKTEELYVAINQEGTKTFFDTIKS